MKKDITTIDDIDFGQLYSQHLALANYKIKKAKEWDTKVEKIEKKCGSLNSAYQRDFVSRINLNDSKTVLDVGCGPGTIGLALAKYVDHVYGLDYNKTMLAAFHHNTEKHGINNASSFNLSWEDNWDDVPRCDIVIASRAMMVNDLAKALAKLHQHARQRVYLTQSVDSHFISPEILTAIGRNTIGIPGYIYTLNILYQMGIHPTLSYIQSKHCSKNTLDYTAFLSDIEWSIGKLNDDEKACLYNYYQQSIKNTLSPQNIYRKWAFISWEK